MDLNVIRSIIFLIAGLILILFPKQVFRFQTFVLDKMHIRYKAAKARKNNFYIGVVLIVIAVVLFAFTVLM
jgi:hypothetical protein